MRLKFLIVFILLIMVAISSRLFNLQISKHQFYLALAEEQYQSQGKDDFQRGNIFTSDGYALVVNREFQSVYAVPNKVVNPAEAAQVLAPILEISEETIKQRLAKKDDPYEPLKHRVDESLAQQIKKLDLPGIYLMPEKWRFYPEGDLASHALGFVGFEGTKKIGQYGLEAYYNQQLQEDDLVLTIDRSIQFVAEQKLKEAVEKWQAKAGTVIVMEPETGRILALGNWPNFDPNYYSKVDDINVFLNPAIQNLFEPGSVFKPITMAAALDIGQITPETTYYDHGFVQVADHQIHNPTFKGYGWQTMTNVLEKSLNTGAVFVQQKIGQEEFLNSLKKFGFNLLTGIDLSGEINGNISNLYTRSEVDFATASFGQGISVTPIQLITALAAIANNGQLMQPYLNENNGPKMARQVVSPQTASVLTEMLVSAVENSPVQTAKVKGYKVAGKTGTAQIPEAGGYSEKTIHSFVGWAPAYEAKFIILLKIDEPKGIRFAAGSLAPTFHDLTQFLLNYYKILPTE